MSSCQGVRPGRSAGLMTSITMKGPSQEVESLCIPLMFWMRRKTKSPTLKDRSRTLRLW
jgi:hypothetical protein